jgi:AraC-like DNA-binding protein
LPSGTPSESSIAQELNITERTLQRKLKDANFCFRDLLSDTRKELACQHLLNAELSINEIAFILGYAEETNFTRAFKRWTGETPSAYRKNNA